MNATLTGIKQRFGIIGNSDNLNRALDVAMQVAPTDLSVLITGESGSGKEAFPKIIHALSVRKHKQYIAVNCGAIPEGTIDSELFGHEKGSFTIGMSMWLSQNFCTKIGEEIQCLSAVTGPDFHRKDS